MSIERLKFKGKSLYPATLGKWIYSSDYNQTNVSDALSTFWTEVADMQIDPATVGQWTGLVDKNGVGIYEHDRCRFSLSDTQHFYGVVVWREKEMCFVFKTDDGQYLIPDNYYLSKTEVIGNVHEVTT